MGAIHRLKPRFVETVKTKGMYPDGGGLYLQVGPEGRAKSWLFRYHVEGRGDRQMGLGPCHTIGLAQARELARQCREQRLNGLDPIDARKAARLDQRLAASKELTFRQCAEGWVAAQQLAWSPDYLTNVNRRLKKYIYPVLANVPVQKINVELVQGTLEWLHKTHPPTYRDARNNVEGILDWAYAKMGHVPASGNPASLKGPLGFLLPSIKKFHVVEHHKALPWKQIGVLMRHLREFKMDLSLHVGLCSICNSPRRDEIEAARRGGMIFKELHERFGVHWMKWDRHQRWLAAGEADERPMGGHALEFLILTAVRRKQVANARWEDIDLEDRVWDCPPEGHKTGKKTGQYHIVPLSDAAMAVINRMKEMQEANGGLGEFVFAGRQWRGPRSRTGHVSPSAIGWFMDRHLGPTDAMQKAMEAGKIDGTKDERGDWHIDAVPHGFRTTFKVWAVEHGYDEQDSEMALAHTIGTSVRNIYARNANRIEPRRLMMQAWADFCGRTEPLDAKIIPMRQARNGETA